MPAQALAAPPASPTHYLIGARRRRIAAVTQPTHTRPYQWVSRDAWLIIAARSLRTFAQASISVFFAIYMVELGYSVTEAGLLATIGSAGSAAFAFLIVFVGETIGRRKLLVGFSIVMGLGGLGFAFTENYAVLALVSFFMGSLAITGGGPRGPIQPLETASLPDTTDSEHRTELYAFSGIIERIARVLGSLAAALPAFFVLVFHITNAQSFKVMFVGYAIIMLASAAMYSFLSPAVSNQPISSGPRSKSNWQNPLALPSRRTIFTLAAIFSVDSFATRFVFFALVALWFKTKFGLDLNDVSYLLAASTMLSAVSLWAAAKLANRFGLLNTIVFTHIPAVICTIAVPFAPWAWLAILLWLVRGFFSQMDGPPKNSYTMAIVNREERTAMASINNVAQATVGTATPWLTTVLFQSVSMTAPFIAAGLLKSIYLAGMYFTFRKVHPPEEIARQERKAREKSAAPDEIV
jgi:MFS family permease